jgi:hypothetical protein
MEPFIRATKSGDLSSLRELLADRALDAGSYQDVVDWVDTVTGATLVTLSIVHEHPAVAKWLLTPRSAQGGNFEYTTGRDPLLVALETKQFELAQWLLEPQTSTSITTTTIAVNPEQRKGTTLPTHDTRNSLVHAVLASGRLDLVQWLVEFGDTACPDAKMHVYDMLYAITHTSFGVLDYLLNVVNINLVDDLDSANEDSYIYHEYSFRDELDDLSPLGVAAYRGDVPIGKLLIQAYQQTFEKDAAEEYPDNSAAQPLDVQLSFEVEVYSVGFHDDNGQPRSLPVHTAALEGHVEFLQWLLAPRDEGGAGFPLEHCCGRGWGTHIPQYAGTPTTTLLYGTNSVEVTRWLLCPSAAGPPPPLLTEEDKRNVVAYAGFTANLQALQFLTLDPTGPQFDIDTQDALGQTALAAAVRSRQYKTVEWLATPKWLGGGGASVTLAFSAPASHYCRWDALFSNNSIVPTCSVSASWNGAMKACLLADDSALSRDFRHGNSNVYLDTWVERGERARAGKAQWLAEFRETVFASSLGQTVQSSDVLAVLLAYARPTLSEVFDGSEVLTSPKATKHDSYPVAGAGGSYVPTAKRQKVEDRRKVLERKK